MVGIGTKIAEIGRVIEEAINARGFVPVKNLSGHGIGHFSVHEKPTIPNFNDSNPNELQENQAIAIEPFATNGAGMIHEVGIPTVFMHIAKRPIRNQFARDLLKRIETYNGLPFTTRWLTREFGVGKTNFGLRELLNASIIRAYPSLPDVEKGLVSQAEHSIIVLDKPVVITKI